MRNHKKYPWGCCFALLLFSLTLLPITCLAQELLLKDGTVIKGTLLSFNNGVYTFSSKTLGEIKIAEAQVVALSTQQTTAPPKNSPAQLEQIQAKILGDDEIMQLIQSLQNDPDVLAILQDPEIMQAIQNGDLANLENNPKLQKLMQKSQVKAIKKKVAH